MPRLVYRRGTVLVRSGVALGFTDPNNETAAVLKLTTNVNPGAGAIRFVVFYRQFQAPTS